MDMRVVVKVYVCITIRLSAGESRYMIRVSRHVIVHVGHSGKPSFKDQ